jgi:hypothetical protein
MSLGRAFVRLRTNARYHGWLTALGLLTLELVRRFVVIERVLLYELAGMPDGRHCPGPERARLATTDELKALLRDPELKFGRMTAARVDQLYAAGHRCVLNVHEGRVTGYSWLGFDNIDIPQVGVTVERLEHEGYIYKGFTHPSCRGKGAADDRYLFWMRYLLERGKRSAVAYFSFDNPATLKRVPKLGMRRIGTVTQLGIGRYRRILVSSGLRNRRQWPLPT